MGTHNHQDDPEQLEKSIQARHELRDGNFWQVGKYINLFFIFTGISFAISFGAMWLISFSVHTWDRPVNSVVENAPRNLPAKAPLQNNITAWKDMQDLRAKEAEQVKGYGVVDESKGVVRIPVDKAMEKLAAKGVSGVAAPAGGSQP